MKKIIAGVVLLAMCVAAEESQISIEVSCKPSLPTENLMPKIHKNWNFQDGLKGWGQQKKKDEDTLKVVDGPTPGSRALWANGYTQRVWAVVSLAHFQVGKAYIASCLIKPDKKLWGSLGMGVGFWNEKWQGLGGPDARGAGPSDTWIRVVGKPYTVPKQAKNSQMSVGMGWTQGGGCVSELCLQEAYAEMTVRVTAPEDIRQVKVMNNQGRTIFDSDVMEGAGKTFAQVLKVETPYTYTIMVVTNDGDVKSTLYPQTTNKTANAE